MSSSYPIFLKSFAFLEVEKSKPEVPQPPALPGKPKLIKKNWLEKLILYTDEYEDQLINLKRTALYLEKLKLYKIEIEKYQLRVNEVLSDTNVRIFRQEQNRLVLAKTQYADLSSRETLKGRYESFFNVFLINFFPDKILDNLEFCLPNGNAFVPDFSYIDKSTGLCVDIEIDEPYTSESKQPIHYINADDYRNRYFQSKGWFVIRFAEIQIVKYPTECCEYISSVINHILKGNELNLFLYSVKSWSVFESNEMASIDFRNSY